MADQRENSARWLPISDVVNGALMDIQQDESRSEQFLKWALDCYDDLMLDHNLSIKDTKLTMTPYKSIELPNDCIDWIVIGVQCGDVVMSFNNDPNMALNYDSLTDLLCPLEEADTLEVTDYFGLTGERGEDLGKIFGRRIKNNGVGYWQENKLKNEIQFRSTLVNKYDVYLKYIADLAIANEVTLIPRTAKRLMENYIHWQDHENSRNPNKNRLALNKERLYWNEYNRYVTRENPVDIYDIIEDYFDSLALAPKF